MITNETVVKVVKVEEIKRNKNAKGENAKSQGSRWVGNFSSRVHFPFKVVLVDSRCTLNPWFNGAVFSALTDRTRGLFKRGYSKPWKKGSKRGNLRICTMIATRTGQVPGSGWTSAGHQFCLSLIGSGSRVGLLPLFYFSSFLFRTWRCLDRLLCLHIHPQYGVVLRGTQGKWPVKLVIAHIILVYYRMSLAHGWYDSNNALI